VADEPFVSAGCLHSSWQYSFGKAEWSVHSSAALQHAIVQPPSLSGRAETAEIELAPSSSKNDTMDSRLIISSDKLRLCRASVKCFVSQVLVSHALPKSLAIPTGANPP